MTCRLCMSFLLFWGLSTSGLATTAISSVEKKSQDTVILLPSYAHKAMAEVNLRKMRYALSMKEIGSKEFLSSLQKLRRSLERGSAAE